jgi:serralysin
LPRRPVTLFLRPEEFRIGAAAQDADDHIIYNDVTGALSFDVDGTGAAAAVQFAQLSAGLALVNTEFLVV